ncbi:MAG TPA: DUF4251 domain-containing protein [Mucilaginibacter sp.]|nr:DUF4251 domain-containing protein [Mucilaginibacter sp.]
MAQSRADKATKDAQVKNLVNSGRYTFEASKWLKKGGDQSVKMGDDLDISKDTLIAYLPDAGKTPMAPVRARSAGITCTNFNYNMNPTRNGGYHVTIMPKMSRASGHSDIRKIDMRIDKQGYATVRVMRKGNNALEFYGYIKQHDARFPRTNVMAMR